MSEVLDLLRTFSAIRCPPTRESTIHQAIADQLCDSVDELYSDALGNLIGLLHGPAGAPLLMVECHIDEIGLMVSTIENTGVLRFEKLGWIDDRTLPAHLVNVHTAQGDLIGVLAAPGSDDRNQAIPYTRLFVDIGAGSAAEAERLGVRVGDAITLRGQYEMLPGGLATCRAVDNRVGVAAIVSATRALTRAAAGEQARDYTLAVTFATQHEVGLRGPQVLGYRLDPDACLVIDVTGNAADLAQQSVRMGGGPVLRVMEEYGTNVAFGAQKGLFAHPEFNAFIMEVAGQTALPYQVQVRRGSIGDGVAVHTARAGVPTASILVPVRGSHTAQEIYHPHDLELTRDLLAELLRAISASRIRSWAGRRFV